MSNFQTTVSIEDIYGKEWWAQNREELNRDWEWSFGRVRGGDLICDRTVPSIEEFRWSSDTSIHCRIILHRRKPQPPTLRGIYGVDEVTIPTGWEWTGEFRGPQVEETYSSIPGKHTNTQTCTYHNPDYDPRLILRKRQPKVWFKAEEKARMPNIGEWFWFGTCMGWVLSVGVYGDGRTPYLCATRHEEPDLTSQTVAQADIDAMREKANAKKC